MRPELVLRGVIPANLMAFNADLEIDERNYRRHIRYLVDTPGVTGLTTNAHASEVATLTLEEQQRSLDITLDEVAEKVPVVCGVYEDGTHKATQIAKMAERQGADCLLVCFPRRFSTSATSSVQAHRHDRRSHDPPYHRVRLPANVGLAYSDGQFGKGLRRNR